MFKKLLFGLLRGAFMYSKNNKRLKSSAMERVFHWWRRRYSKSCNAVRMKRQASYSACHCPVPDDSGTGMAYTPKTQGGEK